MARAAGFWHAHPVSVRGLLVQQVSGAVMVIASVADLAVNATLPNRIVSASACALGGYLIGQAQILRRQKAAHEE